MARNDTLISLAMTERRVRNNKIIVLGQRAKPSLRAVRRGNPLHKKKRWGLENPTLTH